MTHKNNIMGCSFSQPPHAAPRTIPGIYHPHPLPARLAFDVPQPFPPLGYLLTRACLSEAACSFRVGGVSRHDWWCPWGGVRMGRRGRERLG